MAKYQKGPIDIYILIPILLLASIGVIMVLSASSAVAAAKSTDKVYAVFFRHVVWLGIGLIGMTAASRVEYHKLKYLAGPGFSLAIFLLIAVLFSDPVNGARSWFNIGGIKFQPSEMVKLIMVIILARVLSQKQQKITSFNEGLFPVLVVTGIIFGLILLERDLGTALALAMTALVVIFAAGSKISHLLALISAVGAAAAAAIYFAEYRMDRITTFLDPWSDRAGTGYQITQSLFAIGSGGFFGVGLGQSLQKYKHLPEQYTDFIFSILTEETGFLGGIFVILLFVFFASRAYRTAKNCPDSFGSLLACGIATMIMVEAIMNIAVATSSMPVTGVTLPFISYGGSSLMFKLIGIGILLNISRYCKEPAKVVKISRTDNNYSKGLGF